jgi:hypothetical protein
MCQVRKRVSSPGKAADKRSIQWSASFDHVSSDTSTQMHVHRAGWNTHHAADVSSAELGFCVIRQPQVSFSAEYIALAWHISNGPFEQTLDRRVDRNTQRAADAPRSEVGLKSKEAVDKRSNRYITFLAHVSSGPSMQTHNRRAGRNAQRAADVSSAERGFARRGGRRLVIYLINRGCLGIRLASHPGRFGIAAPLETPDMPQLCHVRKRVSCTGKRQTSILTDQSGRPDMERHSTQANSQSPRPPNRPTCHRYVNCENGFRVTGSRLEPDQPPTAGSRWMERDVHRHALGPLGGERRPRASRPRSAPHNYKARK